MTGLEVRPVGCWNSLEVGAGELISVGHSFPLREEAGVKRECSTSQCVLLTGLSVPAVALGGAGLLRAWGFTLSFPLPG